MTASGTRPLILIVDDEPQIQRFLRPSLVASGYNVSVASTGKDALVSWRENKPDLIVLDLGLPDMDGRDVIAEGRGWSDAPIIVLSARDQESEKIAALDTGANDFVNKPFGIGELLARIRAALRVRGELNEQSERVEFGDLVIETAAHLVTRLGEPIRLTPKEFALLAFLAKGAGRVLTHRQILTEVWGPAHVEDTQYLRVLVRQLRQKIESDGLGPQILSEPGIGYKLSLGSGV